MYVLGRKIGADWLRDYKERCQPDLMNPLLHQAVPVLKTCDWKLTNVEKGRAESLLPLNQATTNQHGTHQAALISLSADYTGGMALATLLEYAPLAGIHKCTPEKSASLWLISMDVKYLEPSTGHLAGVCQISDDLIEKVSRRYRNGRRVLVTLPIQFYSNGDLIAEAELKYFAQPTRTLMSSNNGKRSSLFSQKIKASARMIAGIRASNSTTSGVSFGKGSRARFDRGGPDHLVAGPHGMLLANNMTKKLPELSDFVRVRTAHIDEMIGSTTGNLEQLVMLGVGLDMRAFQHAKNFPNMKVYELDLPEMLVERERKLSEFSDSIIERQTIDIDFLKDDIAAALKSRSDFDESKQTIFVYEGCSMYFDRASNQRILNSVRSLMKHRESKLWVDFVTEEISKEQSKNEQVLSFLGAMEDLGEKFVFGLDDPAKFLQNLGFRDVHQVSTLEYMNSETLNQPSLNDVFRCYRMCFAK